MGTLAPRKGPHLETRYWGWSSTASCALQVLELVEVDFFEDLFLFVFLFGLLFV